jgi:hypothetical protein
MPRLRFHAQPAGAGGSAGEFLRGVLVDPSIDSLSIVVAWVRFRGVARLQPELDAFRERGHSRIILGLDEGGATRPGLFSALRSFSEAYVYHAPQAGTFHPKVYLAEGPAKASLFVGSTNMTPGGLYFNDEASLEAVFDLPQDEGEPALKDAQAYAAELIADKPACHLLTEELIERLVGTPRYRISGHERRQHEAPHELPQGADDDDIPEGDSPEAGDDREVIFAASNRERAAVPPLSQIALEELSSLEQDAPERAGDSPIAVPDTQLTLQIEPEEDAAGTLGFWKTLSAWDTSDSSAPGQLVIPIRFIDFFPALTVQRDERSTGGIRQSHALFHLRFQDGGFSKQVTTGRVILYEPAESHPRPNRELRFTFRDHAVFSRLRKDDVLVFRHADDGSMLVERREHGSMGTGRFGLVSTV